MIMVLNMADIKRNGVVSVSQQLYVFCFNDESTTSNICSNVFAREGVTKGVGDFPNYVYFEIGGLCIFYKAIIIIIHNDDCHSIIVIFVTKLRFLRKIIKI